MFIMMCLINLLSSLSHHTISIANTYTAHRRHRHHQVRVAKAVVRVVRAAVNQARAHHGHLVANRASQVVHHLLGHLAERVASLEVTRHHQALVARGNLAMAAVEVIRNLLTVVEEGIRRPSLRIPSHHTPSHHTLNHHTLNHHLLPRIRIPNHPTPNQATLNHRTPSQATPNHPIPNQVTHLTSLKMMDTMVATGVNGGQVALLAAQAHGHRVAGSRVRAEEDLQAHRVAGAEAARQERFEGISDIRTANECKSRMSCVCPLQESLIGSSHFLGRAVIGSWMLNGW